MRCPKCGANNQTTKFCGECGYQLVYVNKPDNRESESHQSVYVNKPNNTNSELKKDTNTASDTMIAKVRNTVNMVELDKEQIVLIVLIVITALSLALSWTSVGLAMALMGLCLSAICFVLMQQHRKTILSAIVLSAFALIISGGIHVSNSNNPEIKAVVSEEVEMLGDVSKSSKRKIEKFNLYISKGEYSKATDMISELNLPDNSAVKLRMQLDLLVAQGMYDDAAVAIFKYAGLTEDKSVLADDSQFERLSGFKDKLNADNRSIADQLLSDVRIAKIESISGHDWQEASCMEPKTCKLCGKQEGTALGHEWIEATCDEPKTCKRCGQTEGVALGHNCEEWMVEKPATCSEEGIEKCICTVCGEEQTRAIPKIEHTEGDWEITVNATDTSSGVRVKHCKVCGEEIASESYSLSEEERLAYYKSQCESVSYDDLIRYPDKYEGKQIKVSVSIKEVETVDSWVFEDQYEGSMGGKSISIVDSRTVKEPKLRAGDSVTIYGVGGGYTTQYTYRKGLILGLPKDISTEKIPCVKMVYVSIK